MTAKGGENMSTFEIATQLALKAIECGYIEKTDSSEQNAEEVAKFFNKVFDEINDREE
jgi:hypothetical protein